MHFANVLVKCFVDCRHDYNELIDDHCNSIEEALVRYYYLEKVGLYMRYYIYWR